MVRLQLRVQPPDFTRSIRIRSEIWLLVRGLDSEQALPLYPRCGSSGEGVASLYGRFVSVVSLPKAFLG
jgi:hypothetical protein